jgi:hypothetical protein
VLFFSLPAIVHSMVMFAEDASGVTSTKGLWAAADTLRTSKVGCAIKEDADTVGHERLLPSNQQHYEGNSRSDRGNDK